MMAFKEKNLQNICAISSLHSAAARYLLLNLTRFPLWAVTTPPASLGGRLEDCDNGILVVGHDKDTAELVKQSLELRAPHVLVVHDLLQVVVPSEVVQQPGGG